MYSIACSEIRLMRFILRFCLIALVATCIVFGGYLIYTKFDEKETWATLAGLLAVIAASIAVLPALRLLEIQEDTLRPRPTPYFDLTSRYALLQLRVKNCGAGVAYDVRLKWKKHPVDHQGNEVNSLDHIPILLPQESVSTLIGGSSDKVKELSKSQFEGECLYKDSTGKKLREKFICSVVGNQKRLLHDDEMLKALHDVQEIPKQLERIASLLEKRED
jgi:hypothetical protein